MNKTNEARARKLVKAGAWFPIVAGFGHALGTIPDLFGRGLFSPTDDEARDLMTQSPIVLTKALGAGAMSVWEGYLGFNISHGIGVGFFGFVILLLARRDMGIFTRIRSLLPLAIGMSLVWFLVSIRYWFYLPTAGAALMLGCFTAAFLTLRRAEGEHSPQAESPPSRS